jgi:hypothetical protein
MKIHKPSTLIKIKLSGQEAFISEVIIGDGYVFYKVTYFVNGDVKAPTLSEYEFEIVNGSKKVIGFHNSKQ